VDGFGQAKRDASGNVWILTHLVAEHYTPAQHVEGKVGVPGVKLFATVALLDPEACFKMDAHFSKSPSCKLWFPFYSDKTGHFEMAEILAWYCTLRILDASKTVESDDDDSSAKAAAAELFRTKAKTRLEVTMDTYHHNLHDSMHYTLQELLELARYTDFRTLRDPAQFKGGNEQAGQNEGHPTFLKNIWRSNKDDIDHLEFRSLWLKNCWQPACEKYSQGLKSSRRSAFEDLQGHRDCVKETVSHTQAVCIMELLKMLDTVTNIANF
jgi:hypothetical protein